MAKNTKKGKSETELKLYFEEHIVYEIEMLRVTYRKLFEVEPGFEWNAFYESFLVHSRNMYHFLRNVGDERSNIRAIDYSTKWSKPKHNIKFNNIDDSVCHMSWKRTDKEKINVKMIVEIGYWINDNFESWYKLLPIEKYDLKKFQTICEKPLITNPKITMNSACTVIQSTSSHYTSGNHQIRSTLVTGRKDTIT